ncbi:MAG: sigma-54 dependent transcriptional regulator [Planctomycetota bacterium]
MARILVVDDTPQNLRLIELYLRGTEFEVVSVTSGHDAIEQSMKRSFDLILLDVVMPGIDGFEVCRRLKNDPLTAFIPVIFLTGRMSDESDKLAAYQLGAVDYIQKPVDREELVARIRVMLRLEDARSRLDRENVALRTELTRTQQRMAELEAAFEDLQQLSHEQAGTGAPELVTLSTDQLVRSFDVGAPRLLGDLEIGRALADCSPTGAAVARHVSSGQPSATLEVVDADGDARELTIGIRPLSSGDMLLMLQDVTGLRTIERRIADRTLLESAARAEPEPTESDYRMTDFIGASPAVSKVSDRVGSLRQKRSTVLIYGESGTGKELVARALHFDGRHRNAPFIPLHCGAIAPELIESELFGHEKGSFTGAHTGHEGLFRAADGGTIFLDEIAETSPSVQVKLLRVLQRGEIRPVGANQPRIVDVRIIAATNRDLLELVQEGKFREDLYYRLEVVTLDLPPLRQRMADLRMLAEHFLGTGNRKHDRVDRPVRGFSKGAMDRMMAYSWPGNVRELENVIEGAFALDVGEILQEEDLPDRIRCGAPTLRPRPVQRASGDVRAPEVRLPTPINDIRGHRDAAEREAIEQALRDTAGDKVAAAQRLGMARSTFYRRVKELGIS